MAGSLNHIVGSAGTFSMNTIEHMGDAREALEECFHIIGELSGWDRGKVNEVCERLKYPKLSQDMRRRPDWWSETHESIVDELYEDGGLTVGDMTTRLGISRPASAAPWLEELEQGGFVRVDGAGRYWLKK